MKNFLTTEERESLKRKHRHERDRRVADRIKAVLWKDKGWTYRQIAEALMLDEDTISHQIDEYITQHKLKPENGGSESKLSISETAELISHLEANTYFKVDNICFYVKKTYNIEYTRQGMTDWLHTHKFSYKQPKEVPIKADPEKQATFVENYNKLRGELPENEPIFFIDSVHPTMATKVSAGWIRTGQDKLIGTTASRTRINLTGAINLKNMKVITKEYDTINGGSTVDFFQEIEAAYSNAPRIHIILDGSGYHRSKEVANWAEAHKIKLHFLPAYSPNLNPIERLWKVMNEHARNNRFFSSPKIFRAAIHSFFQETWPTISSSMSSRINDNFQIFTKPISSF